MGPAFVESLCRALPAALIYGGYKYYYPECLTTAPKVWFWPQKSDPMVRNTLTEFLDFGDVQQQQHAKKIKSMLNSTAKTRVKMGLLMGIAQMIFLFVGGA